MLIFAIEKWKISHYCLFVCFTNKGLTVAKKQRFAKHQIKFDERREGCGWPMLTYHWNERVGRSLQGSGQDRRPILRLGSLTCVPSLHYQGALWTCHCKQPIRRCLTSPSRRNCHPIIVMLLHTVWRNHSIANEDTPSVCFALSRMTAKLKRANWISRPIFRTRYPSLDYKFKTRRLPFFV